LLGGAGGHGVSTRGGNERGGRVSDYN
jgi:hypothetical protein